MEQKSLRFFKYSRNLLNTVIVFFNKIILKALEINYEKVQDSRKKQVIKLVYQIVNQ